MMDKIYMLIAWKCPRGLVYWCVVRGIAATMRNTLTPVPQITAFEVLEEMMK